MDVIIVDDEPAGRRVLRECCQAEQDLRVVGEYGDPELALVAIRGLKPDILFLDIHMEPLNGITLVRALEPAQPPAVVFVTAHDSHAIDAFELCAVDYLLKPFDDDRFRKTLARLRTRQAAASADARSALLADVLARLERGPRGPAEERPRLLAEFNGRFQVIDPARVELLEADRNYVAMHVGSDRFHTRSTLGSAEQALAAQPMLRISRSCLVNVNFVREVNRTLRGDFIFTMAGGATVTSSEGFRLKVRDYLASLKLSPL
jgi:two-component system LytT family response regulator